MTIGLVKYGKGELVFSVRDTGQGIPEHIIRRLFVEEVSTGDVRGVGLGLHSCASAGHKLHFL